MMFYAFAKAYFEHLNLRIKKAPQKEVLLKLYVTAY